MLRTIAAALLGGASLIVLADLATVHAQQQQPQPQPGQPQTGQPPQKKPPVAQPKPAPRAAPIPPRAGPGQAQPKPAPVQPRVTRPPQPTPAPVAKTPPPAPKTPPAVVTPGRGIPPPNARRAPPAAGTPPTTPPTVKSAVPPPAKPPAVTGGPRPALVPPPSGTPRAGIPPKPAPQATPVIPGRPSAGTVVRPVPGPARIEQIRTGRVVTTDPRTGSRIVTEPGNRTIIRTNNRVVVHRNETTVIKNFYPGARTVTRPGGLSQTTYVRRDGVRVITEVDRAGRVIRRFGQAPSGRQIVYVDNRRFYRNLAIGVGVAAIGVGLAVALAPPAVAIPRAKYIVDYQQASEDDIYEALSAPPIEKLDRTYSLEEIRYSAPLRDRMRRVDLDTINFEFGSFEITPDQYPKLERIARAIARAIEQNPGEMFLIEGHTDAVGQDEDNLSLSDRRAEAVARVLVEHFNIPMENLTTQGYGEQHLKVETREAERANRRVAIRRITPLLNQTAEDGDAPPPQRQ